MGGVQILGLVDHDVLVGPIGVGPPCGEVCGPRGGLLETQGLVPVEAPLEFLDDRPDGGPVGAGDAPAPPGAPGGEVVLPGANVLGKDDLLPLADHELPVEGAVGTLVAQDLLPPGRQGGVAEDLDVGPLGFGIPPQHVPNHLVDVEDVDLGDQVGATQVIEQAAEQVCQGVGVGGQQDRPLTGHSGYRRRQRVCQGFDAVQGDNGLAGARSAGHSHRAIVRLRSVRQAPLDRVQEDPPLGHGLEEHPLQFLGVAGDHGEGLPGGGPACGRRGVLGVDVAVGGRPCDDLRPDLFGGLAVGQGEDDLAGELWHLLGDAQQGVLGSDLPEGRNERWGDAEPDEVRVRDPVEEPCPTTAGGRYAEAVAGADQDLLDGAVVVELTPPVTLLTFHTVCAA